MGKLWLLRAARFTQGSKGRSATPNLEALIEAEAAKMGDGYHYARWIVPLACLAVSVGVFLPLQLFAHSLFWIGTFGVAAVGLAVGLIFHLLAIRIRPEQVRLRKECDALGSRLNSFRSLTGGEPILSHRVGQILEKAAIIYQSVPTASAGEGVWATATEKARRSMDEAMARLLTLTSAPSPLAQEAELDRGWAVALVEEMRATAELLRAPAPTLPREMTPASDLSQVRAELMRLREAEAELDDSPTILPTS